MKPMKAVILLGGEGTRLRPLTYDVPKPMVPIVNKPYMEHQVDYLMSYGFTEIVFALGYKSEAFQNYFGDGSRWGGRFWHMIETEPLGTAGCVKNVENLLDDTFLVFNGDILSDIDLGELMRFHREHGATGTLALTPVEDPSAYGVVETDASPAGRVQAFIEKPPPGTTKSKAINAGVYVLEPRVLTYMPRGEAHSFERQLFPNLLKAGEPLYGVLTDAYWLDIGTPARYLQANRDVLHGRVGVPMPEASNPDERHWIHPTAHVDPAVVLDGPVWIGEGATVDAGAHLVGPVVLGKGVHVCRNARIEQAVVWGQTVIGEGAHLKECSVGRGCRVGPGAVLESGSIVGSEQHLEAATKVEAGARLPA